MTSRGRPSDRSAETRELFLARHCVPERFALSVQSTIIRPLRGISLRLSTSLCMRYQARWLNNTRG